MNLKVVLCVVVAIIVFAVVFSLFGWFIHHKFAGGSVQAMEVMQDRYKNATEYNYEDVDSYVFEETLKLVKEELEHIKEVKGSIFTVGDIHGSLFTLFAPLKAAGVLKSFDFKGNEFTLDINEDRLKQIKIVFTGDIIAKTTHPYHFKMLSKLIDLANKYPDNVILLYGNHDISWMLGHPSGSEAGEIYEARCATKEDYGKILKKAEDFFKNHNVIAYYDEDSKTVFSHTITTSLPYEIMQETEPFWMNKINNGNTCGEKLKYEPKPTEVRDEKYRNYYNVFMPLYYLKNIIPEEYNSFVNEEIENNVQKYTINIESFYNTIKALFESNISRRTIFAATYPVYWNRPIPGDNGQPTILPNTYVKFNNYDYKYHIIGHTPYGKLIKSGNYTIETDGIKVLLNDASDLNDRGRGMESVFKVWDGSEWHQHAYSKPYNKDMWKNALQKYN